MGFIDEDRLQEIMDRSLLRVTNVSEIGATAFIISYAQAGGNPRLPADAISAGLFLATGFLSAALFKGNPYSHHITMGGAGALASFADRIGRSFGAK